MLAQALSEGAVLPDINTCIRESVGRYELSFMSGMFDLPQEHNGVYHSLRCEQVLGIKDGSNTNRLNFQLCRYYVYRRNKIN